MFAQWMCNFLEIFYGPLIEARMPKKTSYTFNGDRWGEAFLLPKL